MKRRKIPGLLEVPEPTPELQQDVERIGQFFLHIRGVGHFLSPQDSQVLLGWLVAGYGVESLLRGIHRGATRVARDRRGVRSLSTLHRDVERELKASRRVSSRVTSSPGIDGGRWALWVGEEVHTLELLHREAAVEDDPGWLRLVEQTQAHLYEAVEGTPSPRMLAQVMALSRSFYDQVWQLMAHEDQRLMYKSAEAQLEAWLWPMSPEAREETITEFIISSLREKLDVLVPEKMAEVWEG